MRTSLFKNSFIDDPDSFMFFKISSKRRRNKVDTDHCSKQLMERSINHDKIYTAQLGFRISKPFNHDFLTHNLILRGSSELASNFIDNQYLKSKLFMRYLYAFRSVQF
jgi:hypothetical protein